MVGARLLEDSSIVASSASSSGGSAFFIRELGPRTKARPETQSGKHRSFICSPPCVRPQQNSHFHLQARGQQGLWDRALARPPLLLPTFLGRWEWGTGVLGREEGGNVLNELAVLPRGGSPRSLSLKRRSSKFKSGQRAWPGV